MPEHMGMHGEGKLSSLAGSLNHPKEPSCCNRSASFSDEHIRTVDDCSTRVKAAIEVGTLNAFAGAGRIQRGLQLHLAFEDALQRYAKRFPPPPPMDDD